jgi:hypothetical protein
MTGKREIQHRGQRLGATAGIACPGGHKLLHARVPAGGKKQRFNCDRWGGDSLKWFVYWMQNLPGADNSLSDVGRDLTNWWIFLDYFFFTMP